MSDTVMPPAQNAVVEALLKGAIDPHIHSGPSTARRALDHLEAAREASSAGMAGIITKDHHYDGSPTTALIRAQNPDFCTKIYSGIVLNNAVGGLNPYAVEHCATLGGKIVWLPTFSAENHLRWEKKAGYKHPALTLDVRAAAPVSMFKSGSKNLSDELKEVLDVIAARNLTLASGHIHISEVWSVFEEAKRRGVKKMIVTHAEVLCEATLKDMAGLAGLGAFIEHVIAGFVEGSKMKKFSAEELKTFIDAGGVRSTIISSDLGLAGSIHPVEGFRRGIGMCLELGYSRDDIRLMFSKNAANLFDIAVGDTA